MTRLKEEQLPGVHQLTSKVETVQVPSSLHPVIWMQK